MIRFYLTFMLFLGVFWTYSPLYALDQETLKDMPFINDISYCTECHTDVEVSSFKSQPTKACVTYCRSCHGELGEHHPTGARIKEKIPNFLQLNDRNRLMCYTCHDLTKMRYDTKPWKSQSLFENMFGADNKHKTYFLPITNTSGELCKTCH